LTFCGWASCRRLLVVVGPNGAGKTNLLRLVEIVRAAIERTTTYSPESYRMLVRFAAARRFGAAPGNLSGVRLSIALTEPWERELLGSFVRAAVGSVLLQATGTNLDASSVIARIRQQLSEDELRPLSRGVIVAELVDALTGTWSVSYEFGVEGQRFRWVIEGTPNQGALIRIGDADRTDVPSYPITHNLDIDEKRVPKQALTLATLLPAPGEATALTLNAGTQWAELVREFAQQAGIPVEETNRTNYSLAHVLRAVLDRGLVLLGDLRQPPLTEYSAEEVALDPSPADGSRIPVMLFRLKNGSGTGRRQYARIRELFTSLTGLSFDIALADVPSGQGDGSSAAVQIAVVIEQYGRDLPIEFVGSGIWEALLLSATLPESSGLVAILDEPARNLHPTLQRRLLTAISRAPGQFILTTHSPYLVAVEDAADSPGIIRFDVKRAATRACRLSPDGGLNGARLRKTLRESADARALLFARGVVLVEGGTELGALPEWFAKSKTAARHGIPDALNIVIHSVDGDPGYLTHVAFLHEVGIPWTIVCDGAVYRFGQRTKQIFEQVLDAGTDCLSIRNAVNRVIAGETWDFAQARDAGEDCGIFTLAQGWDTDDESFEAYMETVSPGSLAASSNVVGRSKPRQGRHVAFATECPPEVDTLYSKLLHRLGIT